MDVRMWIVDDDAVQNSLGYYHYKINMIVDGHDFVSVLGYKTRKGAEWRLGKLEKAFGTPRLKPGRKKRSEG